MTYRTFKRSARNFRQFVKTRKITSNTGLTFEQARTECEEFNKNRTARQKRNGTMMEFTAE